MRESIYSTIRISSYEPLKEMLGGKDKAHTPMWLKMCAGALAGLIGSAIANPTDLLKIRMQASEGHAGSISYHAKKIYKHGGVLGFWAGVDATVS